MTTTVYPANQFALRRAVRMQSHAGRVTTHVAERIALNALASRHSVASALSQATRYLRGVQTVQPRDCA